MQKKLLKTNNIFYLIISTLLILILVISSCKKDSILMDSNVNLEFSTDTISFDTLYNTIGSVTKQLKVYNHYNQKIKISLIELAKTNSSKYKININGLATNSATDIIIQAKDSLYIFVEITPPTNSDIVLIKDSIIFTINGNKQDVKLIAYGMDVHHIKEKTIKNTNWTNQKPYLIYNDLIVEKNNTLTIEKGTKIYFKRNTRLIVNGNLIIEGTLDQPVKMQGERLEDIYYDVPGQWVGIQLTKHSKVHNINYAHILNAIIGIQADSLENNSGQLSINNTIIEHMSSSGIYAKASKIIANNCLIDDCGQFAIILTLGGNYEFYHCTIANYWRNSFREYPSVFILQRNVSNTVESQNASSALFGNCIIDGNLSTEVILYQLNHSIYNVVFNNCVLKIDDNSNINQNMLNSCLKNIDLNFIDYKTYNFRLENNSQAIDLGDINITKKYDNLLHDIDGVERLINNKSDIGVYETIINY